MVSSSTFSFNDSGSKIGEVSFEDFFQKFRRRAFSFGLRLLNDTYTSENIVQDAFLKLWQFRETITCEEHAERFLKQAVKWGCYAYFRNPNSRFHRALIKLDGIQNHERLLGCDFSYATTEDAENTLNDYRLNEVNQAIAKFFHGKEKEVIELYFIKGFTHSQIAARYGLSVRTVTIIIDNGKTRLRTILVTAKERINDRAYKNQPLSGNIVCFDQIEGLSKEQNTIYHLRLSCKCDFNQIAAYLNLTSSYVQMEYVKAWKIANTHKGQAKSGQRLSKGKTSTDRLSA